MEADLQPASPVRMAEYIKNNVDNLSHDEHVELINILNNMLDSSVIRDKKNGTQILFRDFNMPTLIVVDNFVRNKLAIKLESTPVAPLKLKTASRINT